MWAIRAVNSEASLQQACNVWKTRDAHKRHASELQIDWKEEERVLGRDTSIGKKKYNKGIESRKLARFAEILRVFRPVS
jgi:hypothetical protein